jgi:L-threonylcarbamoyladenylate synthase
MNTEAWNQSLREAAAAIKAGQVILCPTDTLWGISCDATNPTAVAEIYRIKQREERKSLIVLISSEGMLQRYVKAIPHIAWELLDCSDHPLTIIYPQGIHLATNVLASDGSIGIRLVKSGWCHQLIHRLNCPLVSTSANLSGQPSPLSHSAIASEITEQVSGTFGQEEGMTNAPSSILRLSLTNEIQILRK